MYLYHYIVLLNYVLHSVANTEYTSSDRQLVSVESTNSTVEVIVEVNDLSDRNQPTNIGGEQFDGSVDADNYTWSSEASIQPFNITQNCKKVTNKVCLRKCCKWSYTLNRRFCMQHKSTPTNATALTLTLHDRTTFLRNVTNVQDTFHVVYGRMVGCTQRFYDLRPDENVEDEFYLQPDGRLFLFDAYIEPNRFCVDYGRDGGSVQVLVCFPEEQPEISPLKCTGMIVSIPFLLITLLVYIILPDRNIPAKIIMCFVSTLILAYTFLISLQIGSIDTEDGCDIIAIICHYFFVSSFLWMNVSCIDIYWTFSGLRGFGGSKRAELKRFLLYCAYASGLPLIISGSVFALNYHPDNKAWFHPKIGHGRCWFEEKTPVLLYFYGPLGLIIFANIILFVLTSLKIRKVRKDTVMLKRADSRRHNADEKERFNLYVKLLFAMGVNWSFEIISWAVITYSRVNTAYWIITDFCNAIYGVSIFLIFVFKTKTYTQLKKRYNQIRRRSDPTGTMQDETENTLTSSVSHQKQSMLKINP